MQYDESEDKEKTPKVYKYWQITENENEKRQDLPIDYENNKYTPLPSLKIINCSINLSKEMRYLKYLIGIKSKSSQVKY